MIEDDIMVDEKGLELGVRRYDEDEEYDEYDEFVYHEDDETC